LISEGAVVESVGNLKGSSKGIQETDFQARVKQENSAMIAAAKEILGRGYDRQNGTTSSFRAFKIDDLDETAFGVSDFKEGYNAVLEASEKKASETYNNALKAGGKVSISDTAGFDVQGSRETSNLKKDQANTLYCAVNYLTQAKCELKDQPQNLIARQGDSYVKSIRVYAGYKFVLEISTDQGEEQDSKKTSLSGGAFFSKLGLNINWNNSSANLKNRTVKSIAIRDLEAHGGKISENYVTFDDIESLEEELNRLKVLFQNSVKRYNTCPIDPTEDTVTYNHLDCDNILRNTRSQSLPVSTKDPIFFKDLADNLLVKCPSLSQYFTSPVCRRDLNLQNTLNALFKIFPDILSSLQGQEKCANMLMVLGSTGVGKTTLIGHLLGHKMMRTVYHFTTGGSKNVVDYAEKSAEKPPIGHLLSKTKGATLYIKDGNGYIDTAGLYDTSGKETDLCNARAVQLVGATYHPNRILIVLNPDEITARRGQLFKEIFERLTKIVPDCTNPDIFNNILFYINPKVDFDKQVVMTVLNELKAQCIEELQEILGGEGVWGTVTNWWTKKDERERLLERIKALGIRDPTTAADAAEKLEQYDQLSLFHEDKFVFGDFENEAGKRAIQTWLESSGGLTQGQIHLEHLFPYSESIFQELLFYISHYFNEQFQDFKLKVNEIASMKESVDKVNQKEIAPLKKQIKKLKEEKEQKESEIVELSEATEDLALTHLEPAPPIRPRPLWRFFDTWAQTSKFKFQNSNTPISRVDQVRKDVPGEYINEKDDDLESGEYEVEFRPAWYNKMEDRRAAVTLFTEKKDHPHTKMLVQAAQNRIQRINAEIRRKEALISQAEGKRDATFSKIDFENAAKELLALQASIDKYLDLYKLIDLLNKKINSDTIMDEAKKIFAEFSRNLQEYQKKYHNKKPETFVVKASLEAEDDLYADESIQSPDFSNTQSNMNTIKSSAVEINTLLSQAASLITPGLNSAFGLHDIHKNYERVAALFIRWEKGEYNLTMQLVGDFNTLLQYNLESLGNPNNLQGYDQLCQLYKQIISLIEKKLSNFQNASTNEFGEDSGKAAQDVNNDNNKRA